MPRPPSSSAFDTDAGVVRPDGMTIRRRRRQRGWSRGDLVTAIARASERATGIADSVTPSVLRGIEEENESVPYAALCLVAGGLDCDPVELVLVRTPDEEEED